MPDAPARRPGSHATVKLPYATACRSGARAPAAACRSGRSGRRAPAATCHSSHPPSGATKPSDAPARRSSAPAPAKPADEPPTKPPNSGGAPGRRRAHESAD